jgi:NDP-sugar pyrophosphorylase family protein
VTDSPVGVVLAAGAGTRLRPLTDNTPKALCPVGDRPLVDWSLQRLRPHVSRVAVNAHHLAEQLQAHLADQPVYVSLELPRALGTAGALGLLGDWIAGAPVLLTNADAWCPAADPLAGLVEGWDGVRPRLLCQPAGDRRRDFADLRYVGSALLPWWSVRALEPVPSGLYETSWAGLHDEGKLDLVVAGDEWIDCGTPADYQAANTRASGAPRADE